MGIGIAAIGTFFTTAASASSLGIGLGGAIGAGLSAAGAGIAAAGGAGLLGTLGSTVLGGLVSGYASGRMEEKRNEQEEARAIASERRMQASYEGVGESTRMWGDDASNDDSGNSATIDPEYQRVNPNEGQNRPVGEAFQAAKPGDKFRTRTASPQSLAYNRELRRFERTA